MVKELRDKTNAGMMDCKKALQETGGDIKKAIDYLRQKGLAVAQKRAGRTTSEGMVQSYIHAGGRIGVLVEVNCETDFTAKSEAFQEFVKNLAMHIAATNPLGITREDVPEEVVEREREIYKKQALDSGKPEHIVEKIVTGKMEKFYKESCLLEQAYVKDPDITVQDYLNELIGKTGENIIIRRYTRYQLGEDIEQ
ncbi:MAG TPA: translation elongation factor Ts [Deltaproteobacteria bacterium]|nr:MAG: elongation factor Ts [Deltaproteobacteria bacterium]RLB07853.1 MAG: elongation factor Ts [Deltaproteobacteria bacterium]HDM77762.1 translation elongation factor Ts [Deltaproteobacteria bacterium]